MLEQGRESQTSDPPSSGFVDGASDDLAEQLGEDFVQTATSAEDGDADAGDELIRDEPIVPDGDDDDLSFEPEELSFPAGTPDRVQPELAPARKARKPRAKAARPRPPKSKPKATTKAKPAKTKADRKSPGLTAKAAKAKAAKAKAGKAKAGKAKAGKAKAAKSKPVRKKAKRKAARKASERRR